MRSFFLMCVAAAVLAPQACVGDDPSVGPGGDKVDAGDGEEGRRDGSVITSPDSGTPVRGLSLTAASFEIVRGGSAQVTVKLAWDGEPTAVSLTWAALKPGMDGGTPTIVAAGVTEQVLSLSATEAAAVGDTTVQIVATTGASPDERTVVDVPLLVRGAPGSLDTSFGTNGNIQLPPAPYGAMSVMEEPSGALVVLGQSDESVEGDPRARGGLVLVRYTPRGMLDATFATGGVARWNNPYAERRTLSLVPTLPLGTVPFQQGYRIAFPHAGVGDNAISLSTIAADGTILVTPSAPSAVRGEIGLSGVALPQGDGALFHKERACVGVRLDASGSPKPSWSAELTPAPLSSYSGCTGDLLAASSSQLLIRIDASGTSAWRGLVVVERETGSVVGRTATAGSVTVAAPRSESGFVALSTAGESVWVDSTGAGLIAPAPVAPAAGTSSMVELPGGTAAILVTVQPTHATTLHFMNTDGSSPRQPLELPVPSVVDETQSRPMRAEQAFAGAPGRIVVFYRARFGELTSSTEPNPHWLIRRYWL